ncbi:hypothetical protein [Methylococcus sp. Mc7]|uniref:DUF6969 family protein n=1 Tax=Methylococcus sp. Mc7 TaxID=2860258 RepID=UPI001C52E7FF|nr:hypothetical protein [Methylococcus sp. Mc7]QXP82634.1 hypothetical protein KW115_10315 [Methylococcus sp. Mc7]
MANTPNSLAVDTPDALPRFDPAGLDPARLETMAEAGARILECYRVLRKGGLNIVGEVLRDQGTFYELDHYPKDDVFDDESHCQYYYHAHRPDSGEHGHFHTFIRQPGMPEGVAPVAYEGEEKWPAGDQALTHLVAVSMDAYGFPIGLFATNRWVTAEAWYRAEDVIGLLDRFRIDHAFPSWPVNIWLTNLLILFRPEVEWLLRERDAVVARWQKDHPGVDVYEDRALDVTGYLPIDVEARIREIMAALGD